MISPVTGLPESQHDPSPVPFYLVMKEYKGRKFSNAEMLAAETMGSLSDVAPTLLEAMGIPKPEEMDGTSFLGDLI